MIRAIIDEEPPQGSKRPALKQHFHNAFLFLASDDAIAMTRRTHTTTTGDDDDSLKHNVGVNAQGKEIRVKQENAKRGKARRVEFGKSDEAQISSQPNGAEENGADKDAEGDELDEEGEGTPRSRKRARVDSVGASVPSSPNQAQRQRVQTLPRGDDG